MFLSSFAIFPFLFLNLPGSLYTRNEYDFPNRIQCPEQARLSPLLKYASKNQRNFLYLHYKKRKFPDKHKMRLSFLPAISSPVFPISSYKLNLFFSQIRRLIFVSMNFPDKARRSSPFAIMTKGLK